MNKKILAFIVIVALIIIALFAINSVLKEEVEEPVVIPEEVLVPSVSVPDQASGTEVFIDEAVLPDGGYVVIHRANNIEGEEGTPGDVIGVSDFMSGTENNFLVTITEETTEGDMLFAMLHTDDGDGIFDSELDTPLTVNESVVMVSFEIVPEGMLEDEIKL